MRYLNFCRDFEGYGQNEFEMIAFCIHLRISPLLSQNSSLIDRSTSQDHPSRTSIMLLCCLTQYSGYCCSSSCLRGPYISLSYLHLSAPDCPSIDSSFLPQCRSFPSMNLASTLFCGRCSCSANTGRSPYAFAPGELYEYFGSTSEYHRDTEFASLKFLSISKNST